MGSQVIYPLRDYVHIESLPDDFRNAPLEHSLKSSIVIPDCAKEPNRLGKVLALGSGKLQDGERYEFSVKVGDTVLCPRYPMSWNAVGANCGLMKESEILAKVELNG